MANRLTTIRDGLANFIANLGTGRDKAAHTHYFLDRLSDQEACSVYEGTWLARKIIDIPALDACRNWRSWNAEQAEISKLEAEEKRLGVQLKVLDAKIKARLFGGAAIYIGTGQDWAKPLDPKSIQQGGIKHLNVILKRVLAEGEIDNDPESPAYGLPAYYTMTSSSGEQVRVDRSRLVIFHGAAKPDPQLTTGSCWGESVLTSMVQTIKQADSTAANLASMVFEANVDVIRVPNLMGMLSDPATEKQLQDRFQLAAMLKGVNGMFLLDSEEDYERKEIAFTGLPDVLTSFLQLCSGASDIPLTRLFGQSPAGLNSTGEGDIRNYYDRIRSGQELELQPAMSVLDECLIRSALGSRPPELWYSWRSLWQTSDTERATIGKTTADTIKTLADTGLIPDDVLGKVAVNMLTEAGVAPGLESEMQQFEVANPEWREQQAEEEAAALARSAAQQQGNPLQDATPRPLYVRRDVLNGAEILAWAKEQGFETTLPADDLHVTIAYSRDPVDWMKAGSDWASGEDGRTTIKPGGARLVEKFGGGAVVLLFNSSELSWRHETIKEAGASWDWPEYQPHITITYQPGSLDLEKVEPYRGAIELGPEIFEPLDESWQNKLTEE
ncbi:DUF1073 domain-containing protein [Pseudoxanthomonas winnipegensis]|uniref:Anti-CBASS protein Acb1 n=1 Tax=Pseudoxanthomonas winnipegensis TaxID=2480810 RepID=A0ABY1WCJ2_9GAMM|nr:anti-CBASS Acb1 family protein [Pseudoxanthomonas winnipegensis]TAA11292.1 DUF1073 domain-containing protein [Pseudoxanthomonas winnipegensis]TAA18715.1 DUF1073 domain-containing protein [Pseudoxanthomonas winnipegensis]TAH73908.1 DUF1073 domain-containing protein [Pseudoxanthomonas winnipegensis]